MTNSSIKSLFQIVTGKANYRSTSTSTNQLEMPWPSEEKENGKYNIFSVANWFLKKEAMSEERLNILCFYAQAWNYVKNNYKLIKTDFIADNYPNSQDMKKNVFALCDGRLSYTDYISINFDPDTIELLESVWETYGDLSTNALICLVESEPPFKETKEHTIMSMDAIKEYYSSISL